MNTFCGRTRREFLWQAGGAFTSVALAGMLAKDGFLGKQALAFDGTTPLVKPSGNPLGAKPSMLPGKAKSVIFVFCYGGPSHIDTYDYKPDLFKYDGQTVKVKTKGRGGDKSEGRVVGPKWKFRQYGQCGAWVSDLFPHTAQCVDDMAFVKSMYADSPIHGSAMLMMNSGKVLGGPALGSWANYGLGTVTQNLPGFVELESRIESYELAYRMQSTAPEAVDLSGDSKETKELYGCDQERTREFGDKLLLARRLVERGVRFVQVYAGGGHNDESWDAHGDLKQNHDFHAGRTDKPVAGLLKDLKRRGLLDETLVIWGGEFGRQPTAEYAQGTGRDHNSYGFTMWMAGGGIKGGTTVGYTDELGSIGVDKRFHVKDLHATVLACMGLDPNHLTYFYAGLDQKLVGVEGAEPIREIMA